MNRKEFDGLDLPAKKVIIGKIEDLKSAMDDYDPTGKGIRTYYCGPCEKGVHFSVNILSASCYCKCHHPEDGGF